MKRLVVVFAVLSMFMSGCGWWIADVCGNGGCEPPKSIGTSHDDSDDSTMALAIAGTAIVTAVVIALVAKGSREEPARIAPPPLSQPVAMIAPPPSGSDHDQLLQRMYVQGYLSASTGKCEATIAISTRLATLSPSYHDRYASDPTIATCLRRQ